MCRLEDHLVFWSLHGALFKIGSLFAVAIVCPQAAACHWMLLAPPPISPLQGRDLRYSLPGLAFTYMLEIQSQVFTLYRDRAFPTKPSPQPQTVFKEKYLLFAIIIQILIIPPPNW